MRLRHAGVAAVLAACVAGCSGSDSGGPTNPTPTPAATITIGAAGVSPKSVTVPRGSQVQFVNSSGRAHEMGSDPHPEHTDCPEINSVGFLNPGQSRQTGNLNTSRTCGFHDHTNPNDASLRGTIVIQ